MLTTDFFLNTQMVEVAKIKDIFILEVNTNIADAKAFDQA